MDAVHVSGAFATVTAQVWSAFKGAGSAPQQVYARLDIPRFVKFYSGSARWTLVDELALTSAPLTDPVAPSLARPVTFRTAVPSHQRSAVSRVAVDAAVRDAISTILGADALDGKQRVLCSQRPVPS